MLQSLSARCQIELRREGSGRRSAPWVAGVPLLPGFAPGRVAGRGIVGVSCPGVEAGRSQSFRSGLATSQAAIRVPRAMFIRKTFGYSSLVLHANTLRIQTFWVIRQ